MRKKITLKDIATPLNLSSASVSMILNGKNISRFSKETVDVVLQTAKDLGYVAKEKPKEKRNIHLICPSVTSPYYATILQNIQYAAKTAGYFTIIHTTYWDMQEELNILHHIDIETTAGVIFTMPPQAAEHTLQLSKKIPLVAIGDKNSNLQLDTVEINNYAAAKSLGDYLYSLGHTKAAYLSTTINELHPARILRLKGLQNTFYQPNLDGKFFLYSADVPTETKMQNINISYDLGRKMAFECIEKTPEVTAIIAINDMVAYGAMDALQEMGYRIPEDYSVCGFDNIFPSYFHGISLTSMDHAITERGKGAFQLLLQKIDVKKGLDAQAPITRLEYRSQLVVRDTTAAPRKI